ncbi:unnamed protein product [Mytilus edulis]|uniref:IRG-type G domain-containing protein n=1 Tax=Mytilus edulis TaxID=6550 RepID=A0A8S3UGJ0_MYTED|nr:unnamed protein product [Mytilus edulis]
MGQAESQEVKEDVLCETLSEVTVQKGQAGVQKYLQEHIYLWKEQTVSFAVTGRSATGKSTFINKLNDVKPGDPGFAKSGSGNTTTEPTAYQNPQNKKIVFNDLPGVGTLEFPKETYVSRMKLSQYDYFFIFLIKFLVRSKIDDDLRNAEDDGKREEEVIPEIRKKIRDQISQYPYLKNSDAVFLISSKRKT